MCAGKLPSISLREPGRLLGGAAAESEVNVVRRRPDRNERKEGPFMAKVQSSASQLGLSCLAGRQPAASRDGLDQHGWERVLGLGWAGPGC